MATMSVAAATPITHHPLRDRYFRLWFTGSTISLLGDQFYYVGLPWLVMQQTGSVMAMATMMMAGAIPRAVLMLFGGALSDRISPRKIMIMAALARTVFVVIIGMMVLLHVSCMWPMYVLAAAFGVADAFDAPAAQALLHFILEPKQLVAASSVSRVRTQLTSIVGPAPAGFVVRVMWPSWAFFLDAVSFLFVVGTLIHLPDPPRVQTEKRPLLHSVFEGFHYIGKDVQLRSVVLLSLTMNLCITGPTLLGLTYLANARFGSAAIMGIMLSFFAAGSLIGALLAGIFKLRRRGIMVILVSLTLVSQLAAMALVSSRWTITSILLVMGISTGLANVHAMAWIMERMDATVRGRVSSVLMLCSVGIVPISMFLAGFLLAISLKFMFLLAAFILLLVTLVVAAQAEVRRIQSAYP